MLTGFAGKDDNQFCTDSRKRGIAEPGNETASPGAVRTWIQCYNAIREPYNHYGAAELADEVRALRDAGCTGGFMTWNGASDIDKYAEAISALS